MDIDVFNGITKMGECKHFIECSVIVPCMGEFVC